jgi:hypothetical protein
MHPFLIHHTVKHHTLMHHTLPPTPRSIYANAAVDCYNSDALKKLVDGTSGNNGVTFVALRELASGG